MAESSASSHAPVVAAFDFDGTLSYRDSLLPFLIDCFGKTRTLFHLALLIPYFCGFACKIVGRQTVKEAVLKRFFRGKQIDELKEWGRCFANGKLNRMIKPEGLARLRWHQQQGHRCILVSASLDVYLAPWAEKEGFSDILTSSLETRTGGSVTGCLRGLNCRGPEKVRRLDELLGPREGYLLYAYGDSRGDQELLAYADFAYYRSWGSAFTRSHR